MYLKYILFLVTLLTTITSHANERERIALVIGNADYQNSPLTNTLNDARDIASTLESLDFNVTLIEDANHEQMGDAIENFEKKLNNNSVGLFYYSGHAVQYKGSNYLIPLDNKINRASQLKYRTIDLGEVQEALERSQSHLNLVFLDACRNSPFRGSTRGIETGLVTSSSNGTLIAYSTAPGSVAADGDGRNSPFTKHLLEEITKPNIEVELMIKQVGTNVSKETHGEQNPSYESSISGTFCFKVVNDNCGNSAGNNGNFTSIFLQGLSDVETLTWNDGSRYQGQVKDGQPNGKGILIWDNVRYEGDFKNGKPNGKGIETRGNGSRYEGDFKDGNKDGKGIHTTADGTRYEGEYKDGKRHGQGIETRAYGSRYEGAFQDGEKDGKGIQTRPNGDRYEGYFKDGIKHGTGIETRANGSRNEGEFIKGYFSGNGESIDILDWEDGGRYEGDYKDWKPYGKGIFTFENGRRYEDDVIEKMYKDYVDSLDKEDDQTAKMLRSVLLFYDEERVFKLENITQQESQTRVEPEQIFLDGKSAYNNGDYKTAFIIWEPLAAQGHPRAQFFLARMYLNGWGVPPNQDKAVSWLKKAAAMNHKGAAKKLENLQIINKAEPLTQLTFEDEQAFKEGMNAYRKFDYPTAFTIWEPLALSGFPEAQYFLGVIYFDGRGVRVDKAKAERWLKKASDQGHVEARKELICIYENKRFSRSYSLATKLPNAQLKYNLGLRYLDGICGIEDKTEAIIWFTKASNQGHEEASFKLKLLKSIPLKAFKDGINAYYQNKYPTAYTLLQPLAKKGDSIAKYYVGLMLSNGWGVAKNNKEAIRLLTEAADQGHEKASKELKLLKY